MAWRTVLCDVSCYCAECYGFAWNLGADRWAQVDSRDCEELYWCGDDAALALADCALEYRVLLYSLQGRKLSQFEVGAARPQAQPPIGTSSVPSAFRPDVIARRC